MVPQPPYVIRVIMHTVPFIFEIRAFQTYSQNLVKNLFVFIAYGLKELNTQPLYL